MTNVDKLGVVGLRQRQRRIRLDGTRNDDNAIAPYAMTERVLNTIPDDDYLFLTEPPTTLPTTNVACSSSTGSGRRNPQEVFLDVGVILIWCCVAIASVYYCLTERQRRRRILRRQRQERLEQFSPCKRAKRKMQLTQVLMETTVMVKSEYLVGADRKNEQPMNYSLVHCDLEESDDGTSRGGEIMREADDELLEESEPPSSVQVLDQGGIFSPDDKHGVAVVEVEESDMEEDGEIQHLCHVEPGSKDLSSSSWQSDDTDDGDDQILRIPPRGAVNHSSSVMEVPARCVICLKRYRVNDLVSWSPNNNHNHNVESDNHPQEATSILQGCHHAFHQQCIVEWLAILPDGNCPVCRNVFCKLESTTNVAYKTITV